MGPPSSHRIPRVRWYLGYRLCVFTFHLQDSHLLRLAFPRHSVTLPQSRYVGPYPTGISTYGLASSAFARHYSRNLGWFLFLSLLRCFSSGGSPRMAMYSPYVPWFFTMGVAPFGNLRISRLFAAPRSLSQLVTSFFGSWCQGIHLALFFAWTFLFRSLGIAWVS